jgi:hypothetical protein
MDECNPVWKVESVNALRVAAGQLELERTEIGIGWKRQVKNIPVPVQFRLVISSWDLAQ